MNLNSPEADRLVAESGAFQVITHTRPSICSSVRPSVRLPTRPSMSPSNQSLHSRVSPSVRFLVRLIHSAAYLSVRPTAHPFVSLSVRPTAVFSFVPLSVH